MKRSASIKINKMGWRKTVERFSVRRCGCCGANAAVSSNSTTRRNPHAPSSRNPNHTAYSGLERFYRHARARSIIHHHHMSSTLYQKRNEREKGIIINFTQRQASRKTKQNKQSQKARGRIQKLIGFRRDANSTVVGSLVVSRGFEKKKTKISQFLSTSEK